MNRPFDYNKPFTTKRGWPARLMGKLEGGSLMYPWVVAYKAPDGVETVSAYADGGIYTVSSPNSDFSLINIPEKREGWINVYPNKLLSPLLSSKNEAEGYAQQGRIACIHVSFVEGEGLQ